MATSLVPKPKIKVPNAMALESFQRNLRDRHVTIDADTRRTIDAFQNVLGRIGWGTSNLNEGAAYPMTRRSRDYILMSSLYRSNWIARKVIDCIAEDMMKNFVNIVTSASPEKLKELNRAITVTATKAKLLEAIKWARLFGGAAAVMMIKGQGDQLDEPLDLDSVGPDSYRGLLVLDRWSGISPSGTISTDLDNPTQFGLPEHYMVTTDTKTFSVHHSRVLRFTGRSLPWWEWLAEMRWGISEFELVFDELKKRDNTSWNLASLIFRANIFSIKFKDLAANLSGLGKSAAAQQQFYNILSAQNQLMSNQGLLVLPEDGGIETHQYAFSGINEVYESFMLDICGASEIPMSRLFGRTYSGLGQTNIGDEHTYYDIVGQKQQRELDPQLQKLLPIIALSTWGKIPKDFEWFFKPVRSLSNEEQADLATKLSAPVFAAVQSGLITRKEARKELKQVSDVTNVFSNLNDELTESLPDDLGPDPGEMAEAQLDQLTAGPEEGEEQGGEKTSEAKAEKGERPEKKPAPSASKKPAKKAKGKDAAVDAGTFMRVWDHALEGRAEFQGLKIRIENDIGSTRKGIGPDGEQWQVMLTWPYGELVGTEGVDGDKVDVFLGPNPDAEFAYVVHTQKRMPDGSFEGFDEDKTLLGFDSEGEAKQAFLENYEDPQHFGSIESLPMAKFRERVLKTHVGKKIPGAKSTQKTANYHAVAVNAKQSCQYCEHFVPGSVPACRLVQSPISPAGDCDWFRNRLTVDAAPLPSTFKGATIEERVSDLMECRSFGYEAEGDDFVDYSRGDYRNGSHSKDQWKNVPLSARGRWCRVYFKAGKVDRCECYSSEGLDAEKDVRKGWEGLFSFTQAYGD
jgi:phage-related protein (TIGR01555 family)